MNRKAIGPVVLITGASRGLGFALAHDFARQGSPLILTARGAAALEQVAAELRAWVPVVALAGDVADPAHAARLVGAGLDRFGRIDVLINNASTVGPSPMPALDTYPLDALMDVLRANTVAPLHLMQLVLPQMRERGSGVIVNVTSDAAVNAYPTWGGYGASKAALEHLSAVLAAEIAESGIRIYVVDPGDMNTQMHREAEPGVDLSHLPSPESVAPEIVRLVEQNDAAFGRYEAQKLAAANALDSASPTTAGVAGDRS